MPQELSEIIDKYNCVIRPPDKNAYLGKYFSYFTTKIYVVGTQKNHLNKMVLLSTQNTIMFKQIDKKIITILC